MATVGTKYVVRLHADSTNNIVLDGIEVSSFDDDSFGVSTAAVTTVKVGDNGRHTGDSFVVTTAYPYAYAGADPKGLTVTALVQGAVTAIQALISAGNIPGGGPSLVIATLGSLVAGSGYPNGVHRQVKLYGGTGSGAYADITVSGNAVTNVALTDKGVGYTVADVLTAVLPNDGTVYGLTGSGFSINVATLASPITNTTY